MLIATDPLSLLFIGCFLLGLFLLLATAFMGNLGHGHGMGHHVGHVHGPHVHTHAPHAVSTTHGHTAPSQSTQHGNGRGHSTPSSGIVSTLFAYINPFSLTLFLLGFGGLGYLLHNTTPLALAFILVLAGISGFIVAGLLLAMLNRFFGDSEGATVQDVSDRTGLLGKVSITIQEQGIGEILYVSPGGMRKSIPARSVDGQRLERDQEVVVVNYQQGVAEVDTWDHFINQEEHDLAMLPTADDQDNLRALLLEEPLTNETEYAIRKDLPKE